MAVKRPAMALGELIITTTSEHWWHNQYDTKPGMIGIVVNVTKHLYGVMLFDIPGAIFMWDKETDKIDKAKPEDYPEQARVLRKIPLPQRGLGKRKPQ